VSILAGNPRGKRPLGRLRSRWEDNIKGSPRQVCCGDGRWSSLSQDRVRWIALLLAVLNFRVLIPEGYVASLRR
jgi:hypothetical protein